MARQVGEGLYGYGSTVVLTVAEKGGQRKKCINYVRLRETVGYWRLGLGF